MFLENSESSSITTDVKNEISIINRTKKLFDRLLQRQHSISINEDSILNKTCDEILQESNSSISPGFNKSSDEMKKEETTSIDSTKNLNLLFPIYELNDYDDELAVLIAKYLVKKSIQNAGIKYNKEKHSDLTNSKNNEYMSNDVCLTNKKLVDNFALNIHRIDKDVTRCDRNYWYFSNIENLKKLKNIIYT